MTYMEYDIVRRAAATSLGGTCTRGSIFDEAGAKIGLNLVDA